MINLLAFVSGVLFTMFSFYGFNNIKKDLADIKTSVISAINIATSTSNALSQFRDSITQKVNKLMSQQDDLQNAINDQGTALSALGAAVKKIDADVATLLANSQNQPTVDLTAAIQAIKDQTATLASLTDGLNALDGEVNPPAPPAPAAE